MAEQAALDFLHGVCRQIAAIHPGGARLIICSDGRAFGDLVLVGDDDVSAYKRELSAMLARRGGDLIDVFTLEQAFSGLTFDQMRDELTNRHGTPLDELRTQVHTQPDGRILFNGMHRFLLEDRIVLQPQETRSKLRELTKRLTYRLIQRSHAWSNLVTERFSTALRLSIHPQPVHSAKLGIRLLKARDTWLTPWHATLLETPDGQLLTKRADAEKLGATMVYWRDRPSHFVLQ